MKKRGTLPNQWQDGGHGASYSCLVVEDPSNKLRYVMHRFDVASWTEETVANVTKYYSALVERNSASPVWSAALRVLNSARQSHYFNVVGEFSRLGSFPAFLSACIVDGSRPRRVGSVASGFSRWIIKLATSLASMHELGVVHGDVRFTSLFLKNSDASVVSGEDPDLGDLDALLLGTPMPFAHPSLLAPSLRQRKPPTLPPQSSSAVFATSNEPPSSPEGYNVIPPIHDSVLALMRVFVNPPELSANQSSSNQQHVRSDAACDVYQFGSLITLLIVAFRIFLHGTMNQQQQLLQSSIHSIDSLMKSVLKFAPGKLRNLLIAMTSPDPNARPAMQKVLKELNTLSSDFNSVFADEQQSQPPTTRSNPSSPHKKPASPTFHSLHPPESIESTRIDDHKNSGVVITTDDQSFNSDSAAAHEQQSATSSTADDQQLQQQRNQTPNSRNRRSIAEARLKQRQKQQEAQPGTGSGESATGANKNNNNSNNQLNNKNDDSWFQSAEMRLQQLEELKQEQDRNSPKYLLQQKQQQQQKSSKPQQQQHHHYDPDLNETPPGPMIHSPPKQHPKSASGARQNVIHHHHHHHHHHQQQTSSPAPARASVSPDPQKPAGYAHVRSPIHYHYQNPQQQQQQQQQKSNPPSGGVIVNGNNNKKENNINNGNNMNNGNNIGGVGHQFHELRNMRKHERNALLEKQEREQEEKREQFLQMRAEKERKQEAERKAFLERQREHAAHLKKIKQAKRGILEAVKMQQQQQQQQQQVPPINSNGNNHVNSHHQHVGNQNIPFAVNNHNNNNNNLVNDHHYNSESNNNNNIALLQPQEDVQIFVKRSGQVMRCDDATGFVPMTEEEKNNSPLLAQQHRQNMKNNNNNNHNHLNHCHQQQQQQRRLDSGSDDYDLDENVGHNDSPTIQNTKNRQFHPQVHRHLEIDDDGNIKSDGNLISSVRMQMDSSTTALKTGLSSTTATTDDDGVGGGGGTALSSSSISITSPSALSTHHQHMTLSQKPGLAAAGRNRNAILDNDDVAAVTASSMNDDESPSPFQPTVKKLGDDDNDDDSTTTRAAVPVAVDTDPIKSLANLLGPHAMQPLMAEVDVFSKAPAHVRCHPRANAVFATRVRSIVESSVMPKLTHVFGVATEEEGFMALLVMLGQVLMQQQQQTHHNVRQHGIHQADADLL